MKQRSSILLSCLFLFSCNVIKADILGSLTGVSVLSFFTFPENPLIFSNKMEAFGWFKNGFALANSDTECEFKSVFPVSGTVDLDGGTLDLSADLIFNNVTTLQSIGDIIGNGHIVSFCSSISNIPNEGSFDEVEFSFESDLVLSSTLTIKGNSSISGKGNALILGEDGVLLIDSGATVTLADLEIEGLSADKLVCADDTAKIILDNVIVHVDSDYSFGYGSMRLVDNVSFVGTATFEYTSGQTSTLASQARVLMSDDICFKMGRKEATNFVEPLYFEDSSAELKFDNASWVVTATGFEFTRGTILFNRDVELEVLGMTAETGITIGDGTAQNDATVHYLPGVSLVHKSGYLTYKNTVANKLVSSSKDSRLIRHEDSHIYVAESVVVPPITVELISIMVPPLEVAEYKTLDYSDSRVRMTGLELDITSNQLNAYTYYLNGGDSIFLTKGSLPLNLLIGGSGNVLRGTGSMDGIISFEDSNADLTMDLQGMLANTVYLNGGTINLDRDLSLELATTFSQGGKVNLGGYKVEMGETSIAWGAPMLWEGTAGKVQFHGRFSLSSTWTFSGYCVLVGDEASFEFVDDGEIVVEDNSTLVIKSTRVLGLKDQKIRCLGSASKVVFADVETYLIGDYSFDTGSMEFLRQNSFLGAYTFSYESNQTSTIGEHAEWHMADRAKLSIGRKEATDFVEPLACINATSVLHIDNASFCVTGTGMAFTKGTFLSSRDVDIEVVSTSTMNGFFLGNGVAEDDPVLEMRAAAIVTFTKGAVVYDITDLEGLKTQAAGSRLVRNAESIMHVKQNLALQNIFISMDPLSVFSQEDYTVFTFNNTTIDQSFGMFTIKGTRLNVFTNLLAGNESVFLANGALPLYTVATGAGNTIKGNGTITGGVILQDPTAEVEFNLNGFMANDITLAGASMTLSGNLAFAADAEIVGAGSVSLAQHALHLNPVDSVITSTLSWSSSNGSIELHGNASLTSPWTIDGSCTIRGNGNTLTFADTGAIIVSDGANVAFKDIMLAQVSDNAIVCESDSSSLMFGESSMILDGNYTFSVGSIEFENNVSIMGSYTFAYDSSQTSTIAHDSNLIFANNVLFKAGRKNGLGSNEPLAFTDLSSILTFENASFLVTSSGMELTKGTIVCAKDIAIDIVSTTTTYGLHLGDGTEQGDVKIELHPGAAARFNSGAVLIDSYSPAPLRAFSQDAKMYRGDTSIVHVTNHTVLTDMSFEVSQTAQFTMEPGTIMTCNHCSVLLDKGQFDLTGIRYTWFSNLLAGNHEIFLARGVHNLWTYVSGSGNLFHGNGAVNGNIILLDSNADLTWDVNGMLMQSVTMGGGTLILDGDMVCGRDVLLTGSGIVDLNDYRLVFGPSDLTMTSTLEWQGTNGSVEFNAYVDLSSTWTINGNVTIDATNHQVTLNPTGKMVVTPGSTLELRNMVLKDFSDGQVVCLDDTASLKLENVELILDGDYTFSHGSIAFRNDVSISGAHNFTYDSVHSSTIEHQSTVHIFNDATFEIGKKTTAGAVEPLVFTDPTSKLNFENCTYLVTGSGMQLTKGTVIIDKNVILDVNSTSTVDGLIIGDGTSNGDMQWELHVGCMLVCNSGHVVLHPGASEPFRSFGRSATLSRKAGSVVHTMANLVLSDMTFEADLTAIFSNEPGVEILCSDCSARLTNSAFDMTSIRYNFYTNTLDGNHNIFLKRGNYQLHTRVNGTGNRIHGNGALSGLVTLLDSNAELDWALNGALLTPVIMNGGTLDLESDLDMGSDVVLSGSGTVKLNSYRLHHGSRDLTLTSTLLYEGDAGEIDLHANLELSGVWTFSGNHTIHGNGNNFALDTTGQIVVTEGSHLTLYDITVSEISEGQIICLDDTGVITLDNVNWSQDGNYSFTHGALEFKDNIKLSSNGFSFAYQSNQTSTILSGATLKLDTGTTFSYDPAIPSKNLIEFIDDMSTLVLNGATLHATVTGLELTKGKLQVKGVSTLCSETQVLDEDTILDNGVSLGNGYSDDDMSVEIALGSILQVPVGSVIYNNINAASWYMVNKLSTLSLLQGSRLQLDETLNLGEGILQVSEGVEIDIAADKEIIGSVFVVN